MVFTSLVGFMAALSVNASGVANGNIQSYTDYLTSINASQNNYDNGNFYSNISESPTSVTFYVPVEWDTNINDQHYINFYYSTLNGTTNTYEHTFVFGIGYSTSWVSSGIPLRYYLSSTNYDYVVNFDLSIAFFSESFAPYANLDENIIVASSYVTYSSMGRSNNGFYSTSSYPNVNANNFGDITIGYGMLVTISINDIDRIQNVIYSDGYNAGYTQGLEDNQDSVYQSGYDTGYQTGYSLGFDNGARSGNTSIMSIMGAIVDTPILILRSLFDYELFGSSIYIVMLSLVTMCAVIWLVRKFI